MVKGYAAWAARWRVPLGFALGFAYLVFSQPTQARLVAGVAVALLGLALRGWAAGFLEKNQSLATHGPYRYTRNPLYLGSALTGLGLAIAGGSVLMMLALASLFLLVYGPVMRREEHLLRQKFGAAFDGYAASVALLLPRRPRPGGVSGQAIPASGRRFCWARYRKNREYEAALGFGAALVFLILKMRLR
jgi:protein-S-isoprenylcysteine O-methyltransferase Ste14